MNKQISENWFSFESYGFEQGRNQGAKGSEVPPLAKSKLRKIIKYRLVWTFVCHSDLKLRDLSNLWS